MKSFSIVLRDIVQGRKFRRKGWPNNFYITYFLDSKKRGFLGLKMNTVVKEYLASSSDMLSTDWQEVVVHEDASGKRELIIL